MSTKPSAPKHATAADSTQAVDALMKALVHPAKAEIQALRAIILTVDSTVCEGVKWNAPSFRTTEYFATVNLRAKQGVAVVLHFGAKPREAAAARQSIADPQGLLTWLADDRAIVNFGTMEEIVARTPAFQAVLRHWITHVN